MSKHKSVSVYSRIRTKVQTIREKLFSKKAFTLAEVLTTLTVIGIIAAITVPILTGTFGESRNKVAYKKAINVLTTGIKAMIAQEEACVVNNGAQLAACMNRVISGTLVSSSEGGDKNVILSPDGTAYAFYYNPQDDSNAPNANANVERTIKSICGAGFGSSAADFSGANASCLAVVDLKYGKNDEFKDDGVYDLPDDLSQLLSSDDMYAITLSGEGARPVYIENDILADGLGNKGLSKEDVNKAWELLYGKSDINPLDGLEEIADAQDDSDINPSGPYIYSMDQYNDVSVMGGDLDWFENHCQSAAVDSIGNTTALSCDEQYPDTFQWDSDGNLVYNGLENSDDSIWNSDESTTVWDSDTSNDPIDSDWLNDNSYNQAYDDSDLDADSMLAEWAYNHCEHIGTIWYCDSPYYYDDSAESDWDSYDSDWNSDDTSMNSDASSDEYVYDWSTLDWDMYDSEWFNEHCYSAKGSDSWTCVSDVPLNTDYLSDSDWQNTHGYFPVADEFNGDDSHLYYDATSSEEIYIYTWDDLADDSYWYDANCDWRMVGGQNYCFSYLSHDNGSADDSSWDDSYDSDWYSDDSSY